ncbi:Cholesterol dehydrogenase [Thalassovita gelatinovora]|uniref:Cholesterol dehydrogenase n=1 Tax=Thalassovita gelatinovora TaxID=53501 RepID=A0A0P1F8A7_THAGE|nr:NAD-dependent epimerase/dehydratase family protein [Thalassovita gelatinovora]QIZ80268.1 NAD-dependent epimerase/dehydratase family protein [Thalassovita gelatinovora]CUH64143.1 Cholesterol dehydrogenase [Thalassovita gelatinovora]SEQ84332.1 Nucleoside-diphosphate-sugar epimerase [Thalassovita gelatinovora]
MEKKRFLVTGGAGFMGINLVRYLLDRGHEVRSYDIAPFSYPEADRISELRGDVRDRSLHDAAFDGIDVVVHCAAALPLAEPEEIHSTNVDGTRTMLDAARDRGIDRFIHISSTAVYGIPDHHPLTENDAMIGVGPYGESKVQAEHVCIEARDKGLTVSVLRPKSFVGPERLGAFELLYEFAADGHSFPVLGSGDNLYQLLDVDDLNQAVYLCAHGDAAVVNDVFNIGAERFGSLRQSFQAVLDRAGFGKRIIGFPAAPAIWTLRALEALHLSPLYKWIYETAGKDSFVSIDKAKDRLGYRPEHSNEEALIRNYEWYLSNRDRISAQTGVTHRVPWKKGALAMLRWVI